MHGGRSVPGTVQVPARASAPPALQLIVFSIIRSMSCLGADCRSISRHDPTSFAPLSGRRRWSHRLLLRHSYADRRGARLLARQPVARVWQRISCVAPRLPGRCALRGGDRRLRAAVSLAQRYWPCSLSWFPQLPHGGRPPARGANEPAAPDRQLRRRALALAIEGAPAAPPSHQAIQHYAGMRADAAPDEREVQGVRPGAVCTASQHVVARAHPSKGDSPHRP